jgi:hypothetical protein
MRRIQFSEDEVLQLKKERLEHEHPIVRRRMMALYLKALAWISTKLFGANKLAMPGSLFAVFFLGATG